VGVILNLVDQIHSLRWALSNRIGRVIARALTA